jgi:hypothetical protein
MLGEKLGELIIDGAESRADSSSLVLEDWIREDRVALVGVPAELPFVL